MRIPYRREIDGLRAVAVIPVILFHAGFRAFSGGFVGVDVFFVISGYLITSLIVADQNAGTFTLLGFYERRARRILPALFAVMFACLPFAWWWLFPPDLQRFSQSVIAVSAFASNIWFWHLGGYFDTANDLKPLLHTWSLGVEEQYYLLFPLLLIATRRLGKRSIVFVLVAVAAASFAVAQWPFTREWEWLIYHRVPGVRPAIAFWNTIAPKSGVWNQEDPLMPARFYLLHARAWELLSGALLAFYVPAQKPCRHPLAYQVGSAVGLLLIAYAVFRFDRTTPFRSVYTLIPISGACLIIASATPRTLVGRLLGSRPLVGAGLVSYSAYLWHQPLFAFARHRSLSEPDPWLFAALSIATLVLAYVTWRFVETPFREKRRFTRAQVFAFAASCSVLFAAAGSAGYLSDGFPSRLPDSLADVLRGRANTNPRQQLCDAAAAPPVRDPAHACVFGTESHVVGVVVGDSHADALAYSLGEAFEKRNMGIKEMAYSGTPFAALEGPSYQGDAYRFIRDNASLKYVVLASRWPLYFRDTNQMPMNAVAEEFAKSVKKYLKLNRKIFLVYPVPETGFQLLTRSAKAVFFGRYASVPDLSTSYDSYKRDRKVATTTAALDGIGEHPNLIRIRPDRILCDTLVKDRCVVERNGVRLYYDDNHLSNVGARLVADEVMKHVEED